MEVKASFMNNPRKPFEMSKPEITFAEKEGDAYHIYRVTNITGDLRDKVILSKFINPAQLWKQRLLRMTLQPVM